MKNQFIPNDRQAEPVTDYRRRAKEVYDSLPWPSAELEAWRPSAGVRIPFDRYRPYEKAEQGGAPFSSQEAADTGNELLPGFAGGLVFEGGRLVSALLSKELEAGGTEFIPLPLGSAKKEVAEALNRAARAIEDRLQAWQLAELTHGVALRIPDGVVLPGPLLVEFREKGTDACAAPHLVVLGGSGTEADIVARLQTGGTDRVLVNFGATLIAGAGGRLSFTLDQNVGPESRFFGTLRGYADRDATIMCNEFHLGGRFVKTHSRVDLLSPGSSVRFGGAYVCRKGRHMDVGTVQRHAGPRGTSNALYKGIVAPGGRSVYQGLIVVDEGAEKTDAYLSNKNILLGGGARADSMPKLVIGNNDVRCTHGSTTGKIDPAQLFYLIARGLPKAEAEELILSGFLEEVFLPVPEAYRENLKTEFSAALTELRRENA